MNEVILRDDGKKVAKRFRKTIIYEASIGCIYSVLFFGSLAINRSVDSQIITFAIIFYAFLIPLLGYLIFCYVVWNAYEIEVSFDEIRKKTIKRTLTVSLNDPFTYECKKTDKRTKYYSFTLIKGDNKLRIITIYYLELNEILQSKLREHAEKAAQTEVATQTETHISAGDTE